MTKMMKITGIKAWREVGSEGKGGEKGSKEGPVRWEGGKAWVG